MYILIVDDDALIRKWLTMLLKQIPNREISVDAAENGAQALKSIQEGPIPDLLITDIKMPQMDGLELCQILKRRFPQIPVVILIFFGRTVIPGVNFQSVLHKRSRHIVLCGERIGACHIHIGPARLQNFAQVG